MVLPSDKLSATGNPYEPHRSPAGSRAAYGEESPEALRRRVEVLLDEMMLGGVDTASAGPARDQMGSQAGGSGTAAWTPADEVALDYDGASPGSKSPGSNGTNGGFDAPPGVELNGAYTPTHKADEPAPGDQPILPARGARNPLVSAEDRYAHLSGAQPGDQPAPAPSAAPGQPETSPATEDWPAGSGAAYMPASSSPLNPTVRRQSPSLASMMSVGVRAANRSNLLPRSNEINVDVVQQEIDDLLRAIPASLPAGNEAVERSRHLLNKAQTLLQSEPTRTAEVEYYLQQVRRIVQRTRQTEQWSSLYRNRLTAYLWAWLLLGAMVVAALIVYLPDITDLFSQLLDAPALWSIAQQGPVVLAGAFAGALGASVAALFSMQRRSRREFGHFDRKYGLRGLLLPLMGFFFGFLLALLWTVVYLLAAIDPVLYGWAVAAPAALAFVVGFSQEWLYGARI